MFFLDKKFFQVIIENIKVKYILFLIKYIYLILGGEKK